MDCRDIWTILIALLPVEDLVRCRQVCTWLYALVDSSLRYHVFTELNSADHKTILQEAIASRQTNYILYYFFEHHPAYWRQVCQYAAQFCSTETCAHWLKANMRVNDADYARLLSNSMEFSLAEQGREDDIVTLFGCISHVARRGFVNGGKVDAARRHGYTLGMLFHMGDFRSQELFRENLVRIRQNRRSEHYLFALGICGSLPTEDYQLDTSYESRFMEICQTCCRFDWVDLLRWLIERVSLGVLMPCIRTCVILDRKECLALLYGVFSADHTNRRLLAKTFITAYCEKYGDLTVVSHQLQNDFGLDCTPWLNSFLPSITVAFAKGGHVKVVMESVNAKNLGQLIYASAASGHMTLLRSLIRWAVTNDCCSPKWIVRLLTHYTEELNFADWLLDNCNVRDRLGPYAEMIKQNMRRKAYYTLASLLKRSVIEWHDVVDNKLEGFSLEILRRSVVALS